MSVDVRYTIPPTRRSNVRRCRHYRRHPGLRHRAVPRPVLAHTAPGLHSCAPVDGKSKPQSTPSRVVRTICTSHSLAPTTCNLIVLTASEYQWFLCTNAVFVPNYFSSNPTFIRLPFISLYQWLFGAIYWFVLLVSPSGYYPPQVTDDRRNDFLKFFATCAVDHVAPSTASSLGITMATRTGRIIPAATATSLLPLPIRGRYIILSNLERTSSVYTRRTASLDCR